jgi:hypothetical protein
MPDAAENLPKSATLVTMTHLSPGLAGSAHEQFTQGVWLCPGTGMEWLVQPHGLSSFGFTTWVIKKLKEKAPSPKPPVTMPFTNPFRSGICQRFRRRAHRYQHKKKERCTSRLDIPSAT